nr:hypothetical protein GCM10020092_078350 [Actinoplanes digitatis]
MLPAALLDSIAAFGRATDNATPFMVLLSGYAALLARYTGQEDICIGCPIATRTRAEWQPLIGFFVSTLPLRIDLSGQPTFRQLVRRVREVTLDAYAHLHAPLENLAQLLSRGSAPAHAPLFQAIFAMQTGFGGRMGHLGIPGLRIEPVDIESRSAKADLILGVGGSTGRRRAARPRIQRRSVRPGDGDPAAAATAQPAGVGDGRTGSAREPAAPAGAGRG